MSAVATTCFVCKTESKSGKLVAFTEASLKKCKDILQTRIASNFKYADLTLPENLVSSVNIGYHVKCYRAFTAVSAKSKNQDAEILQPPEPLVKTRSQGCFLPPVSSTGVLPKVCIFCHKNRKFVNLERQDLIPVRTFAFEESVKKVAHSLNDIDFLAEVGDNFVAKEVHYHKICWLKYSAPCLKNTHSQSSAKQKTGFDEVMEEFLKFVHENIVIQKKAYLLVNLLKQFAILYEDMTELECSYTTQRLESKLVKHFSESLTIGTVNQKKVVFHRDLSEDQLQLLVAATNDQILFKETASKLRKIISKVEPSFLPSILTTETVKKGEVETPPELSEFLSELIGGTSSKTKESEHTRRRVKSLAEDIIFSWSKGKLKPSKHITLGLSMMSLTSSRKIIDILNRYGHTLSYSTLESIETELCYSDLAISEHTLAPSAMIKSANLATGVAFNNFDRYVETIGGKDTLHDTVGIAYQISDANLAEPCSATLEQPSVIPPKKRRRKFESDNMTVIEPYRKKPKFTATIEPLDYPARLIVPESLSTAQQRDLLWMVSVALELPDTPMWIGFNAKTIRDTSPRQNIFYLPPINQSPTSNSVVLETMKRAKQIAAECGQENICVTYDLAIAKVAFQIQCTEAPAFDNLFIQMGDFHTMMAFFHAIGKVIEDCGLTDILVDAEIIAGGSVNGFLQGKHFNRCKRIHPIISLALQILHFQSFLTSKNLVTGAAVISELEELSSSKENLRVSGELGNLLAEYRNYCDETLAGNHGKTSQFFYQYVRMINYYFWFSRSIREGDFQLYTYVIPKFTSFFFALNQPNYARWLVKYHENLMKVKETHPELMKTINSGCFAVRRTALTFSRSPVDLTLEQTINADAANKLTGISHFTNSISARERWARQVWLTQSRPKLFPQL